MKVYKNEVSIDPKQNQHFYPIPSNLDIRGLILYDAVEGARWQSKPEKQIDMSILILGLVSTVRFRNWDEYDSELSFVRLSSQVLKKYARRYKRYLQYFKDKGIIETDESYQENSYCKGYRFTDKYRNQLLKYEFINDPDFCDRISNIDERDGIISICSYQNTICNDYKDGQHNSFRKYSTLAKSLSELTIDIDSAIKQLNDEIDNKDISIGKANGYLYYFNSVLYHKIYFTIDNTGGRLHTTITSFPKRYRKYLKHPKVGTWGKVDVKNCQPFLLGILMYENILSSYLIKKYKYNNIPIMWSTSNSLPEDAKMYIESCSHGTFYKDFAIKVTEKNGRKCTRDQMKDRMVKILFEPIHWSCPEKEVFKEVYPSVFEFMTLVNGEFKVTNKMRKKYGKEKSDENKMAHILQRAESHIILDHVVKQIVEIDEEIPILTIHDELMVPEEKMNLVVEIMEDVFRRMTNITPKFTCEVLEPLMKYRAA